jgi:hypothetical protein
MCTSPIGRTVVGLENSFATRRTARYERSVRGSRTYSGRDVCKSVSSNQGQERVDRKPVHRREPPRSTQPQWSEPSTRCRHRPAYDVNGSVTKASGLTRPEERWTTSRRTARYERSVQGSRTYSGQDFVAALVAFRFVARPGPKRSTTARNVLRMDWLRAESHK